MTIDEKKRSLIRYRLKQAEESYDEAVYLAEGGKNPRSVMNRLYYAMFYSVLALLVNEQFASSKHKGVISFFNKRLRAVSLEDTLKGKIIAWKDPAGRQSKKFKDLGDIARLVESHSDLWELLDPELKEVLEKP